VRTFSVIILILFVAGFLVSVVLRRFRRDAASSVRLGSTLVLRTGASVILAFVTWRLVLRGGALQVALACLTGLLAVWGLAFTALVVWALLHTRGDE
jgi:hypothetical protein